MQRKLLAAVLLLALVVVMFAGCSKNCATCPGKPAVLYLNKHKIDFGASGLTSSFTISNKGEQALNWTVTVNGGNWLSVSDASGSNNATITCTAARASVTALGISHASIVVSAPGAANTTTDSIEVYLLNSGAWVILDSGTFDSCAVPTADDYYWVKQFELPAGADAIMIDSISFNFCGGGEDIQLLAYDFTTSPPPNPVQYPGSLLYVSTPPYFTTEAGWNTYAVNWHIESNPFYLGFFQMGMNQPSIQIDLSPLDTDTTGCWTARDQNPNPDSVSLAWYEEGVSKTFAVRAHISPVFQYLVKQAAGASDMEIRTALEASYRLKGSQLQSIGPLPLQQ